MSYTKDKVITITISELEKITCNTILISNKGLRRVKHDTTTACQPWKVEQV